MSSNQAQAADDRLGRAVNGDATGHAGPADDREPLRAPFPRPGFNARRNPKEGASLGTLIADTPRLFVKLAKDELERAKRELMAKGIVLGTSIGLFAVAAFFALTLWVVLVTAAILGLNEAFAPWLSALIVAGAFLLLTIILGLAGYLALRRSLPLTPANTIESVKQDVNAVKGLGKYE
ncbi:MAG: phage holin family protein [Pseudoclavibacter sp.]